MNEGPKKPAVRRCVACAKQHQSGHALCEQCLTFVVPDGSAVRQPEPPTDVPSRHEPDNTREIEAILKRVSQELGSVMEADRASVVPQTFETANERLEVYRAAVGRAAALILHGTDAV